MVKDLRLGFKVMRYCYNWKANIIVGIVFAIIGIAMLFMEGFTEISTMGWYFMVCASLMPVQSLYSMSISNMSLASPLRKKMQTMLPVVVGGSGMLTMYLITVVIYGVAILVNRDMICSLCNSLLLISAMMLIMMLYIVAAYKYFIVSIFVFILVYVCFFYHAVSVGKGLTWVVWGTSYGSFALAAAIGLAPLAIGAFLAYRLSLLIYRAPISKMAMPPAIRKQM